jgi:hypothetical protein
MLSTIAPLLVAAENHVELPVPPIVYGLIALSIFAMGLGALFAFRQAATKLPRQDNTVAHDEHGTAAEARDHH